MAMPVDVRQLALVTDIEAPVVPRQVAKSAKVIEVPVVEVREWGQAQEWEAQAKVGAALAQMGTDIVVEKTGIAKDRLAAIRRGGRIGVDDGERILALDVPVSEPPVIDRSKALKDRKRWARAAAKKRAKSATRDSVEVDAKTRESALSHLRALVNEMTAYRVGLLAGIDQASVADMYLGVREIPAHRIPALMAIEVPQRKAPMSRDVERSKRKGPRSMTISTRRMTKASLQAGALLFPEQPGVDYERPKTRGDCERMRGRDESGRLNPCAFVSCRHHLAYEVSNRTGSLKANQPHREVWEMPATCSLDECDANPDGLTLEQVAEHFGMCRERVRQIEVKAFAKLVASGGADVLRELLDKGEKTKGRVHLRVIDDESEEVFDGQW